MAENGVDAERTASASSTLDDSKTASQDNETIARLERENSEYRDLLLKRVKERDDLSTLIKDIQARAKEDAQAASRRQHEAESQIKALRDRMAAAEAHYNKEIQNTHKKYADDMDSLRKAASSAKQNMESAVLKYAQREAEIMQLNKTNNEMQERLKKLQSDYDALHIALRGHKNEKYAQERAAGEKVDEDDQNAELRAEIDRLKRSLQESEAKVIVGTNKLQDVENQMKRTRDEMSDVERRWLEAREEARKAKRDVQRLQDELNKAEQAARTAQAEASEQSELLRTIRGELDSLKAHHKETLRQLESMREQLEKSEQQAIESAARVSELEIELGRMRPMCDQVESSSKRAEEAESARDSAISARDEAEMEAHECRMQAQSTLVTNEQLSQCNAQLSTQCRTLEEQVQALQDKLDSLNSELQELRSKHERLKQEHESMIKSKDEEITTLTEQLNERKTEVHNLRQALDDEHNRATILNKKNAATTRELRSELAALHRKIESQSPRMSHELPVTSDQQATVSANSTSCHSDQSGRKAPSSENPSRASSPTSTEAAETQVTKSPLPPDVNMERMVEKICKLQRQLARRAEKLEFLEEHVRQLKQELQNKSRIVQMYAVREDVGALTTRAMDANKMNDLITEAELSKYGDTTMAAIFAADNERSSRLPNEMLVEINRKLQLVLEDALLKNITLKQSLETMGEEIARLSRENRAIQSGLHT